MALLCIVSFVLAFDLVELPDSVKLPALSLSLMTIALLSGIKNKYYTVFVLVGLGSLAIATGYEFALSFTLENLFSFTTCWVIFCVYLIIKLIPIDTRKV